MDPRPLAEAVWVCATSAQPRVRHPRRAGRGTRGTAPAALFHSIDPRASKVVHSELPADDLPRAAFYQSVPGETSAWGESAYWLVRAGDEAELGADGALLGLDSLHQGPVLIAAVESIDDALNRVRDAGGSVVQDKPPVPGVGWSAYFIDPEGNTVGLFQNDPRAATG